MNNTKSVMRTLLVISYEGEDPDEIAAKYSDDITVEPYVYMTLDDAAKMQTTQLAKLSILLSVTRNDDFDLPADKKDQFKILYNKIKEMTPEEYFEMKTIDCEVKDGVAYSTTNPDAMYRYPKCYQFKLDKYGEEAEFSNPLHLLDGGVAYRAHFNDIDWSREHGYNKEIYEKAWDICVEGVEPSDLEGELIKKNMSNRLSYFQQFENKEAYVRHSTSFFTSDVATSEAYYGVDYTISDIDWVAQFYDRFIKDLKDNPLLSIYEIRAI